MYEWKSFSVIDYSDYSDQYYYERGVNLSVAKTSLQLLADRLDVPVVEHGANGAFAVPRDDARRYSFRGNLVIAETINPFPDGTGGGHFEYPNRKGTTITLPESGIFFRIEQGSPGASETNDYSTDIRIYVYQNGGGYATYEDPNWQETRPNGVSIRVGRTVIVESRSDGCIAEAVLHSGAFGRDPAHNTAPFVKIDYNELVNCNPDVIFFGDRGVHSPESADVHGFIFYDRRATIGNVGAYHRNPRFIDIPSGESLSKLTPEPPIKMYCTTTPFDIGGLEYTDLLHSSIRSLGNDGTIYDVINSGRFVGLNNKIYCSFGGTLVPINKDGDT